MVSDLIGSFTQPVYATETALVAGPILSGWYSICQTEDNTIFDRSIYRWSEVCMQKLSPVHFARRTTQGLCSALPIPMVNRKVGVLVSINQYTFIEGSSSVNDDMLIILHAMYVELITVGHTW